MPWRGAAGAPPVDGRRVHRRRTPALPDRSRCQAPDERLCGLGMLEMCCPAALTFASMPGDARAQLSVALRACGAIQMPQLPDHAFASRVV